MRTKPYTALRVAASGHPWERRRVYIEPDDLH